MPKKCRSKWRAMVEEASTVARWSHKYFHEIQYFCKAGGERSSLTRAESTIIWLLPNADKQIMKYWCMWMQKINSLFYVQAISMVSFPIHRLRTKRTSQAVISTAKLMVLILRPSLFWHVNQCRLVVSDVSGQRKGRIPMVTQSVLIGIVKLTAFFAT